MLIEFKSFANSQSEIAFCMIDRVKLCANDWIREIVKNQADYTVHNITGKRYDLYQGTDEDQLLNHVANNGYKLAVVFSTGTEFINGREFFTAVESLIDNDFFIAGHILDRGDAYYELHHQCYVINLQIYKNLDYPKIGQQELGSRHYQVIPWRSPENIHDDYTPFWISGGDDSKHYNHKCHGWNILSVAFEYDETVLVFDEKFRNNKIHLYPEYLQDFNKNIQIIYQRENIALTSFIHYTHTEWNLDFNKKFKQVLTPASGIWYKDYITSDAKIIFYDYNKATLDYWRDQFPSAKFVHIDLINNDFDIRNLIDINLVDDTLINLSNIFCYEGTSHFYTTDYKVYRENLLIDNLQQYAPTATIFHSGRSAGAYDSESTLHGELTEAKNLVKTDTNRLKLPTWRIKEIL